MPYIGNTPADKFLTLAKQNFSTSATTSYTLDSAVSSTQDIALFINNVRQSPVDAYSVSGTALTLTSATAGTDEMYCVYLGKTVGTVSPASDSIATAMIQANAVTGAKLNTDVISAQTALGATPADTDELLVSDAGVLKRVDYSYLKSVNTPSFGAYLNANQSISNSTNTKITFNTEYWDSDGKFDTSNNRFTPTIAGKYFFNSSLRYDNGASYEVSLIIYKNGSEYIKVRFKQNASVSTIQVTGILDLDTDDYVEIYGRQAQGGSVDVNGDTNGTDSVTARFFGYKLIGV